MSEMGKKGVWRAGALLCMLCSLYYASQVQQFACYMGVKYEEGGLTAGRIDQIYEEAEDGEIPYVTGYRRQREVQIENPRLGNTAEVTWYGVYGEMYDVIPKDLYRGSFVQKADKEGCVISLCAAQELFGSSEVLGCELKAGGETYVVRGILKSKEALLLIQEETNQEFPCLELRYDGKNYPASGTKAFLQGLGLPEYDSFTEGNLYAGMAGLFMGFSFLLLLYRMTVILAGRNRESMGALYTKKTFLFDAGGVVLLCLIMILIITAGNIFAFSEDYLPPRVSDFPFWPNLLGRVKEDYRSMLLYQTWPKEALILSNLKKCIVLSLISAALMPKR